MKVFFVLDIQLTYTLHIIWVLVNFVFGHLIFIWVRY